MTLHVKNGGVWKEVAGGGLSIKDGGIWKAVQEGYVRDASVWKKYYENTPPIGSAFGGGFFAGLISYTANGVPTHALIVAPKASGQNSGSVWQSVKSTTGATSPFDGAANTALMTNSPAANFCTGLTINGFSDWYLPARFELEIAYFNLKSGTGNNTTSVGINNYAVPQRTVNYTTSNPAQTSVAAFQAGGSEAFNIIEYWTSTEITSYSPFGQPYFNAFGVDFFNGGQPNVDKSSGYISRAFRKLAL